MPTVFKFLAPVSRLSTFLANYFNLIIFIAVVMPLGHPIVSLGRYGPMWQRTMVVLRSLYCWIWNKFPSNELVYVCGSLPIELQHYRVSHWIVWSWNKCSWNEIILEQFVKESQCIWLEKTRSFVQYPSPYTDGQTHWTQMSSDLPEVRHLISGILRPCL